MTIDSIGALVIGAFIGFGMVQGMFWLVMKAKSQSISSPDGSINIQAKGDLYIGTKRKGGHHGPSDSDMKQLTVEEPENEAAMLKRNLLD